MNNRVGPTKTVNYYCTECKHLTTERFYCQSDTGYDKYCNYFYPKKFISSYNWNTPNWCPYLEK